MKTFNLIALAVSALVSAALAKDHILYPLPPGSHYVQPYGMCFEQDGDCMMYHTRPHFVVRPSDLPSDDRPKANTTSSSMVSSVTSRPSNNTRSASTLSYRPSWSKTSSATGLVFTTDATLSPTTITVTPGVTPSPDPPRLSSKDGFFAFETETATGHIPSQTTFATSVTSAPGFSTLPQPSSEDGFFHFTTQSTTSRTPDQTTLSGTSTLARGTTSSSSSDRAQGTPFSQASTAPSTPSAAFSDLRPSARTLPNTLETRASKNPFFTMPPSPQQVQ